MVSGKYTKHSQIKMGYNWVLDESSVILPETDKLLTILHNMNTKYHLVKRGGSSDGRKWFSWMAEDYDKTLLSVREIFENLGFECEDYEYDEDDVKNEKDEYNNYIQLIGYNNKRGQEMLFLAEAAPFIDSHSYMRFTGEDGIIYEYTFEGGKMYETIYDPSDSDDEIMQHGKKELYREIFYSNCKTFKIEIYSNKTPFEQYKEQLEKYVASMK